MASDKFICPLRTALVCSDRVLAVSYSLMLPLAILAAGFLAGIFIIFSNCDARILSPNVPSR